MVVWVLYVQRVSRLLLSVVAVAVAGGRNCGDFPKFPKFESRQDQWSNSSTYQVLSSVILSAHHNRKA